MKLLLDRYNPNDEATLGTLSVDGNLLCWTLEDVDRQLELYPENKIFGKSAIPRGTYSVVMQYSPHFGRDMPHLVDVHGFTYIMIHYGNSDVDTLGCILVGGKPTGKNFIPNSKQTFAKLLAMIEVAEAAGEKITIEIR